MMRLLLEIGLLIVGCIVFPMVFIAGVIYTFVKHIIKLNYSFSKQLAPIVRSTNLALDGLANAGAGEMLNDAFKINGTLKYGKWYQTISAVTGLIKLHIKDTKLRVFLDKVLGKEHCVKAITEEDKYYYENHTIEKPKPSMKHFSDGTFCL